MAYAKADRASIPTAPRPRPRRAHWRALLEACRRSGLSQAEFCRRRVIRPGTLAFWKHTLAREARASRSGARRARSAGPPFVPVRVVAGPPPAVALPSVSSATGGEVELVLEDGLRVRVRGRVDGPWLGQVIHALERRGC